MRPFECKMNMKKLCALINEFFKSPKLKNMLFKRALKIHLIRDAAFDNVEQVAKMTSILTSSQLYLDCWLNA